LAHHSMPCPFSAPSVDQCAGLPAWKRWRSVSSRNFNDWLQSGQHPLRGAVFVWAAAPEAACRMCCAHEKRIVKDLKKA
jgi:hypothetical protein